MNGLGIVILVLVIGVIYAILQYNGFITLRNRVTEAWSDIEVQMKRRYDMIPNLVNTVKGYAKHESHTLEEVIKARHAAMGQQSTMQERSHSESVLGSTLKSLFAVSENYPELKANQNFLELQKELRDTEDKLQAARRFYNGNVLSYNTKLESFPSNIIAALFHFEKKDFFELDEAEKDNVKQSVKVEF